jgi:hypothetical protein
MEAAVVIGMSAAAKRRGTLPIIHLRRHEASRCRGNVIPELGSRI